MGIFRLFVSPYRAKEALNRAGVKDDDDDVCAKSIKMAEEKKSGSFCEGC